MRPIENAQLFVHTTHLYFKNDRGLYIAKTDCPSIYMDPIITVISVRYMLEGM